MKCPKCHFENPPGANFCSKCATQLISSEDISIPQTKTIETPIKELTRGTTFAERYEFIEELGIGGMGRVYKVFDKKISEDVALKILKPEISEDEKTIERFGNELKFTRKIVHKNVCRMYDLNEDKGTQYITMEYVPGEDLKSTIVRVGRLSVGKAVFVAKQVSEGLTAAHHLGVVHRDLKPQNIMIDKEGNVRIMDFGIARSLKTKGITAAGMMIGTPEYMSPEQAELKETDQRSDIYSLGVILYEMVTGRLPFEGDSPLSIAMKHKSEKPSDPREFNAQVSEELSHLILRCMEKDKEKRYQRAEELYAELDNIEKDLPTRERVVPKRKPITSREITLQFSLKKLLIPAFAIIAVAIIAVLIWRLVPQKRVVPFPHDKPSLAVMYFENNTGDENFDHWRKALSDLLVADLSQSKYIMVLSGEKLYNILEELNLLEAKSYSSKVLKKVSTRGGVQYILVGKLAMAGETLRINALLQEASTGDLMASEMVEGRGEESLFSMVDDLTRKIKASFKLSEEEIAGDIDKEVGEITTSSSEAYKYYIEGMEYFSKGDSLKSIPPLEIAVAFDPEFAMAYRTMANAYYNIGYRTKATNRYQKAFELSDRVSDRERYYIEGVYYQQSEKTFDKAIETYNELLKIYPDDYIGNNNLGEIYIDLEEWHKAIPLLEVNIQNKNESVSSYETVAYSYAAKGLYEKARNVLKLYLSDISDNAYIRFNLANNYLYQGKYNLAQTEVEKAFSLDPKHYSNSLIKGDIYHYKQGLSNAEKEYMKLLETEEPKAYEEGTKRLGALYLLQGMYEKSKEQVKQGLALALMLGETEWSSWFHLYLAYMHLTSRNLEEALNECNEALTIAVKEGILSRPREALYFIGRIRLEMKSMDKAQKTADELKKLIEKGMNRKAIRLYYHLMGMIELKKQNFSEAIEYFNQALSLLPSQFNPNDGQALFIDPLAFAYYKAGDYEKARQEYERIINLTTGRLFYGDIYAKSFYMLAKIFEEKKMPKQAIEHYEKFLDLWKDADPGIVEAEDAKNRLAEMHKTL
jgi:serine/threonine protein kinase/Tfp pilus assembly protein PilF